MPTLNRKKRTHLWADEQLLEIYLKRNKQTSEEEATSEYARSINLPYLDLSIFPVDQENVEIIPKEKALALKLVVIRKAGKFLRVGALNPQSPAVQEYLASIESERGMTIELFVVSLSSLKRAWLNYDRIRKSEFIDLTRLSLKDDDLSSFDKELKNLFELEKQIKGLPTTRLLGMVMAGAIKIGASDVHFEPEKEGKVKLRYRIDGVLQTITEIPTQSYNSILSRIKMMSGMMINVREISQDGRFSINTGKDEEDTDVRVSVLPGNFGESIVMRILSSNLGQLKLENSGLEGRSLERLLEEIEKKQGIIINSGPTGSGKTTTLYSLINRLNTPGKKIITIEDPVEYQLKGIVQTQVEKDKGYTFANGLRAIVRQDPDVILVGEIRDEETAEIAVHSALTGHLVLSTIHANTSAGVISRLVDLGIKPSVLAPSLNVLIAQRLVRKLCPNCKEKYVPAKETVDVLKRMLSIISPKAKVEIPKKIDCLWRSKGCSDCKGLGYRGRIGIFEILTFNDELRKLIEERADENEILKGALEEGLVTMEQDGILKSLRGETSLEELQRVLGKGDYLLDLYEKIMVQVLGRGFQLQKYYLEQVKELVGDKDKLRQLLEKSSVKDVIGFVLAAGLIMKAGDIHIEPGEKEYKIRFRIDGVLQDIVRLPINEYLPLLNEVKVLSGFKTESRQGVADGRFSINFELSEEEELQLEKVGRQPEKVEVRVSIILGGYGDIIVMRLLNQSAQATNLEDLHINPYNLKKILEEITKPNGMILNTGPTGSGKTTTLYSLLRKLNKPEIKIITVEDPIEYQMEGIIQTQINKEEDYTFANAMRSLLRQNPDIMMIGEIRDGETAEIAYQAALTGHLVLSTLHANSASGAVQRLMNMGVGLSDLIAGTNCFIAQRLVRKLCLHCKKETIVSEEERKKLQGFLGRLPEKLAVEFSEPWKIFHAVGCSECAGTGYRGRIAIMEVLQVNKEIEKCLSMSPSTRELEAEAMKNGMITLKQDGALAVLKGLTTIEEVSRVAGFSEE